ncbi:hypothetical protein [Stieleria bergensis]|uniref:hypothetical protein n=1 Tax=Stieleria bergensis TaxID=2528025 RepID=UPI003AF3515B
MAVSQLKESNQPASREVVASREKIQDAAEATASTDPRQTLSDHTQVTAKGP